MCPPFSLSVSEPLTYGGLWLAHVCAPDIISLVDLICLVQTELFKTAEGGKALPPPQPHLQCLSPRCRVGQGASFLAGSLVLLLQLVWPHCQTPAVDREPLGASQEGWSLL